MRTFLPLICALVWLDAVTLMAGGAAGTLCAITMLATALLGLWEAGQEPRSTNEGPTP